MKFIRPVVYCFFSAGLALGCAYHDAEFFGRITDQYDITYMFYPSVVMSQSAGQNIVKLTFDKNRRVVKRLGGYSPANYLTGFEYAFSNDIYDEVTYGDDLVVIQRKHSTSNSDLVYRKEIFSLKGQVFKTTIEDDEHLSVTLLYYDASGVLSKTIETRWRLANGAYGYASEETKFFFYVSGNLTRVDGQRLDASDVKTTTVEKFSEYDSGPNPNRNLGMFDEVFYRSLSRNNFRQYAFTLRDNVGTTISKRQNTWDFQYDDEGVPIFF
jgi:hypothetical protein